MKAKILPLYLKASPQALRSMTLSLIMTLFIAVSAFGQETVVDKIVNSPDHTILEQAVIDAGLVDALNAAGPFTVFAPTDQAFADLEAALGADAFNATISDIEALTAILTYHVVGANALSTSLTDGDVFTTLNGDSITISIDASVMVDNATVTNPDIVADNGVVHVIDAVMIPYSSVADVVIGSPDHNTLETAVIAAGLAGTLSDPDGNFTVFAPTDAAFEALGDLVGTLLQDPTGDLKDILLYHVVDAKALSTDLSDGQFITTLYGDSLMVTIDNGVFINDAKVTLANIEVDNGVVHVIDAVLTKPDGVVVAENSTFGDIFTDRNGNTLYFFAKDADGSSMCVDGCLDNWPIFYAENPWFGPGIDASLFGVIDRGNGVMQSTYEGWPLYYFVNDTQAGDVKGDGVIERWFVAKPDYTIMLAENQLVGADGNNYTSEYVIGEEQVTYFTDAEGNTLYTWVNDFFNTNNFTAEDFSNNDIWPVYEENEIVVPSILDASKFGSIDVFGTPQLTYNGNPLYFFGSDSDRGETKGVSVPSPGIWPVAQAETEMAMYATVVDVVVNSEDHTTLETAVIAAGLAGTLSDPAGDYTVFAPTDAAFAALGSLLDDLLLQPEGALKDILLYHVVGASALSTDLSDKQYIQTLNGDSVRVKIMGDMVYIDGAMVTASNIETGNGVVHVIDAVVTPFNSIMDVVASTGIHNTLETAIFAAELDGVLNGTDDYTLFGPTDAAFAALGDLVGTLLQDPKGDLADILLYHVVQGEAPSSALSDGMMVTTVNGDSIKVAINGDGVFVDDAEVTIFDVPADNGIVHVIDAVMIPYSSVADVVIGSPDHNTLETAVIAAGLAGTLSDPAGDYTVFAPTDAAFAALGSLLDDLLLQPEGALKDILLYHVVGASALSTDLSDKQYIQTLNGDSVRVKIMGDMVYIDGAMVTAKDIEVDNGVVHVIDAVITPFNSVVDVISSSAAHTSLEAAIFAAGLDGALAGEGPFTVFAPTDDAFSALGQATIDALFANPTGDLASILQYHVVSGKVADTDLSDGQIVEMLEGTDAFVSLFDGKAYINQAMITVTNLDGDNGTVHVIDAVITQPTSIVDIVVNSPRHESLEAAVTEAGLAGALADETGSFTLFAPTDAAFAALGQETIDALFADATGALANILKYHVVGATAFSGDLSDGQTFTTLEGSDITISIDANGVMVDGANVIFADYEAPNGVVHVIDAVIQPTATSFEENSIFSNTRVYPNPARDMFNVEFELRNSSEVSVEIYDMIGQQVSERSLGNLPNGSHTVVMNTISMEEGLYVVIVNSGQRAFANKVRVVR